MVPHPYRVTAWERETEDVVTISLMPVGRPIAAPRHGQFNMLTAFGLGECAISVSGFGESGLLVHTIRDVGAVSHALCEVQEGDVIGVRGPFGVGWGIEERTWPKSGDVVVVAGGIGLAPLRTAILELVERASHGSGRVFLVVGAREPSQLIFREDLAQWAIWGAHLTVTVDVPTPSWKGRVGLVTAHLGSLGFEAEGARALLCGPEIMMRFTARSLIDLGVRPTGIKISLERNMQCGLGWCGHCQLGPLLLCKDGPVTDYTATVGELLMQRER
jgi:anaerobic sulfite reductase subunit B